MNDSRLASLKYFKKMNKVFNVQRRLIYLLLSIVFAFGLVYFISDETLNDSQIYVLFLLFLSIGLWVTEAIPPFAVGLLIFAFLVFALGGHYDNVNSGSSNVQKYVQTWSNSVVWLMLGGFFLAEAMQKVGLDRMLFKMIILKFGTRPRYVLLGIMITTAVFSMIMSNTATTAMMLTAVLPFIKSLDRKAPMLKSLLIGVPTAASLGGIGTIIGSPPNAIVVEALNNHAIKFGFLDWMSIGFPVSIIMIFLAWVFLIKKYVPKLSSMDLSFLKADDKEKKPASQRRFVLGTLIVTLLLWLTGKLHGIPASAISLLPITLLTMFRIVSSDDVRKLPWDTLMLVSGGLSLGLAIKETGLAQHYVNLLQGYNLNLYVLVILFSLLTVVLSNFMSNTATATILIPIAIILAPSHTEILPLVIGISASEALFLPISTPPNAIAFSTGKISQRDFRYMGVVVGLIGPLITIGGVLLFKFLAF